MRRRCMEHVRTHANARPWQTGRKQRQKQGRSAAEWIRPQQVTHRKSWKEVVSEERPSASSTGMHEMLGLVYVNGAAIDA